ncbi:MAG TPA: hypothetical protein VLA73_11300 [Burkholderiales bacterium]|nr:hypothetical protein [Burkholderiales bacterium]
MQKHPTSLGQLQPGRQFGILVEQARCRVPPCLGMPIANIFPVRDGGLDLTARQVAAGRSSRLGRIVLAALHHGGGRNDRTTSSAYRFSFNTCKHCLENSDKLYDGDKKDLHYLLKSLNVKR